MTVWSKKLKRSVGVGTGGPETSPLFRRRRVGKQLGRDGAEGRGASGEGVTAESPVTLY